MLIHVTTLPMQDAPDTSSSKGNAAIWFATLLKAETIHHDASHATLLAWIMSLPGDLDPSLAAASVLDHQRDHAGTSLSEQLTALLRNVAICSRQRLERLRSGRRRGQATTVN